MFRSAIAFVSLFLLASCASTPSVSPQARSIEKNGIRGVSVAAPPPTVQIGGGSM